jgi:hypothetical protein
MPWFNIGWSDFIKKRVCKFLLNRYLGQFLMERLTVDQLNVDFYNGRGTVHDISLYCEVSNLIFLININSIAKKKTIFTQIFKYNKEIVWGSILSDGLETVVSTSTLYFLVFCDCLYLDFTIPKFHMFPADSRKCARIISNILIN